MTPSQILSQSVSAEDAENQLQKIISSSTFSRSERLNRFLMFTVRATLDGKAETVKESVLALEVFDRNTNYDPRIDSVVRVQASRLRVKLKEYYDGPGVADEIEIAYPRGTYVPVFVQKCSAVETAAAVEETVRVVKSTPDRWRYFAYAALWILSVLIGHVLIAAGANRFTTRTQHVASPVQVVAPHTALQPVTSRDLTPLHEPAAPGSKL